MNYKNVSFLVGKPTFKRNTLEPYSLIICNFISELSLILNKKRNSENFPDIKTLSFWCRKKNIENLRDKFDKNQIRSGLGLLFHITPSNIPTNFAYSLLFGLLTGNSNLVKVPSKKFKQIDLICKCLNHLLKKKKFKKLSEKITIVRYENNDEFTKNISSICDGRLIWGGNKTINEIRQFKLKERSIDIAFSDRFSLSIINSNKLLKLKSFDFKLLIKKFYNDTFLVDQNACSSPHLLIWYGNNSNLAKNRFWRQLNQYLNEKYTSPLISFFDKITKLHRDSVDLTNFKKYEIFSDKLYVITLKKLNSDVCKLRGKWGYFYEYSSNNLNNCIGNLDKSCQTLTYYGFNKNFLKKLIVKNQIEGIDRIVPIGQALDISLNWDGYDLNKILSRVIDVK